MGMAVFDEPKNLSIVSMMAAGDIPPALYECGSRFRISLRVQLLGASLVRLGGLQPWSAFDLQPGDGGVPVYPDRFVCVAVCR
jgi:hypothetical protein